MERFCAFFSFQTFQLNYNIDLRSYRQLLFLFVVSTNLSNSTLSNIYPNNYLYIHLSRFYLSNILAVHLSINSSISLFIYPSISPSLYLFIHPYLHLSIYLSIHISIFLYIYSFISPSLSIKIFFNSFIHFAIVR